MRDWFKALLGISAVLLTLLGCNSGLSVADTGGSGTETIGGILVDTLGTPVQNAIVRVDTVSADSNSNFYLASTNLYGRYKIVNIPAGVYTLEGHTEDCSLVVYIDYINYVNDEDSLDLGIDTMRATGHISGQVLLDSVPTHGVEVYVHGISFSANSDGNGYFTISNIPEGNYVISYRYDGYKEVTDSNITVVSNSTTTLATVNLIWDINDAPPAPSYVTGSYDTATGVVQLSWEKIGVSDLSGYNIYRKDTSATDTLVNIGSAKDTLFYDSVFNDLTDTNTYPLIYQVTAVDTLSNESSYSPQANVIAASPTLVRTFFTWTVVPDTVDTNITGDTITLAVSFTNKTRRNILLRWFVGDPVDTVRTVSLSAKFGEDTLIYTWQDTGSHPVCVAILDEKGDVWHDSCKVSINGIDPVNAWQTFFPLVHARRFSGVAVINNTIYTAGGVEDLFIGMRWVPSALASLESFTFGDSSWKSFTIMPSARYAAAVVSIGEKLFVIGGMEEDKEHNTIEIYNTQSGVWENAAPMPTVRFSHAACVINDSIYIFGGIIKTSQGYITTDSIHAYDPVTSQWVFKGTMDTGRADLQVVVLDSQVYILGGTADHSDPEPLKTMAVYNPVTQITTPAPAMLHNRSHFGAAALNGKIYVAGGFTSMKKKEFIANVEAFDPTANTWIVRKALPKARHAFAICVYNNTMYVVGGADEDYPDHLGQTASVLKYYP